MKRKRNNEAERIRQAKMRAAHGEAGLCKCCNEPVAPGRKYCQRHLDLYRQYHVKYRKDRSWNTKGKHSIPAKQLEKILK